MMQYSCSPKYCPCGDKCTNLTLGKLKGIPEGKDGLRVIWVSLADQLESPSTSGSDRALLIQTGDRGFGLKTTVPIKAGQFVMEYRGEVRLFHPLSTSTVWPDISETRLPQIISRDESYRRVVGIYKDSKSYYFLDYDGDEVIDAVRPLPILSLPSLI